MQIIKELIKMQQGNISLLVAIISIIFFIIFALIGNFCLEKVEKEQK